MRRCRRGLDHWMPSINAVCWVENQQGVVATVRSFSVHHADLGFCNRAQEDRQEAGWWAHLGQGFLPAGGPG